MAWIDLVCHCCLGEDEMLAASDPQVVSSSRLYLGRGDSLRGLWFQMISDDFRCIELALPTCFPWKLSKLSIPFAAKATSHDQVQQLHSLRHGHSHQPWHWSWNISRGRTTWHLKTPRRHQKTSCDSWERLLKAQCHTCAVADPRSRRYI